MSRNIRRKLPLTPVKGSWRRASYSSSSVNLSDDDGYSALEDISDSEDDDEDDVNAAEEKKILKEALDLASTPRPLLGRNEFKDAYGEHDADEDEDDAANICGGEDPDDRGACWTGIVSENEHSQLFQSHFPVSTCADVQRHVHFNTSSSSSDSTATEDHDDLFPDIFVEQSLLDPSFRREIEHDADDSCGSGSYWDVHGLNNYQQDSNREEVVAQLPCAGTPAATPPIFSGGISTNTDHNTPAVGEKLELDGYETDNETTDKDVPEPPIRRKTRLSNPMSEDFDSDEGITSQPQHGQPRVGRFKLDRSDKKPIGVLNPLTRTMMIFTPDRRRSLDLSPEQFHITWPLDEQHLPLSGHSANLMISAMVSNSRLSDLINGSELISSQPAGPTEAFFPFSHEANTTDDGSLGPSEDEEEMKLNVDDFISWHDENDASSVDDGVTS